MASYVTYTEADSMITDSDWLALTIEEKQQKRVFELMAMKKEEQLALIEKLGGSDDGRGTAEERIKLIIELEKGL